MRNRAEVQKTGLARMTDCKYTVLSKDAFPSRFFNGEVSGECITYLRMILRFTDFALNLTRLGEL